MQYLGGLRGVGVLTCGGETIASADYDFDGFLTKMGQVTGSGEIRLAVDTLKEIFGRRDLKLRTDEGWLLSLTFSEKRLRASSDVAHVDVADGLPPASEWRR